MGALLNKWKLTEERRNDRLMVSIATMSYVLGCVAILIFTDCPGSGPACRY